MGVGKRSRRVFDGGLGHSKAPGYPLQMRLHRPAFASAPLLFAKSPALALALFVLACGGVDDPAGVAAHHAQARTEAPRAPCSNISPLRRALFGDLHVHTALSSDAWNYEVEVRPADAYRYAFGEAISLPALAAGGSAARRLRIERPLDFAAVTDHAEFLGEQSLCSDATSAVYETSACRELRAATTPLDSPLTLQIMSPFTWRDEEICGAGAARCAARAEQAFAEIIAAAEAFNDRSAACRRTTFVAYEYSSHRLGSNLHRNVIFRNTTAPRRPISYIEAPRAFQLREALRKTCLEAGNGCDVLTILHNSNLSNGRMFAVDYPQAAGRSEQAARARLRAALEPLVEVYQHKGASECRRDLPGVLGSDDPLCEFETFVDGGRLEEALPPCSEGGLADWWPHLGPDCLSPQSYARSALTLGLVEQRRIGVNPFKFGLVASTDTHNGLAGGVSERRYPGHLGVADASVERRLRFEAGSLDGGASSPGGLVGVFAEENSRDAIFRALRRREVFGTSGPRIEPRFFGAWSFPENLCEHPELLARADESGVPMGSDLPAAAGATSNAGAAPHFAVFAKRDPGSAQTPGTALQRLQIVKGWGDDEGELWQRVTDVAGGENGADVDPENCAPRGPGHDWLCAVYRDPDFDPARAAVYYARVIENPSCRYTKWQCLSLPEHERPAGCAAGVFPDAIQERAWTSPIWYTPPVLGRARGAAS